MDNVIQGKFKARSMPLLQAAQKAHPDILPSKSSVILAKVFIHVWFETETALFALRPAVVLSIPTIVACPWKVDKRGVTPALFGRLKWFYLTHIKTRAISVGGKSHRLSWYLREFQIQHGVRLEMQRMPDSDMINYWKEQNEST